MPNHPHKATAHPRRRNPFFDKRPHLSRSMVLHNSSNNTVLLPHNRPPNNTVPLPPPHNRAMGHQPPNSTMLQPLNNTTPQKNKPHKKEVRSTSTFTSTLRQTRSLNSVPSDPRNQHLRQKSTTKSCSSRPHPLLPEATKKFSSHLHPKPKPWFTYFSKSQNLLGASTSPLLLQPNPANPKSTSSVTRGEIRTREVKGGTTPLPHKKLHNNIMPQLPSRLPSSTMLLLHNNIMLQPHNRLHNNTTHPPPNPAMVHQLPNNTALRPHNNNNNTALQLPNNTTLQPHSRLHNNTMPPHLSPATVHQPHNNTTPLLPNKPLNNTTHPPHNVSNNLRSTELPSLLVMHDIRKDILDTASTDIQLYKQQWKGVAAAIFSFFDAITCSTTTLSPPSKQLISTYIFVPVLLFQTMKCIIFIPCTM